MPTARVKAHDGDLENADIERLSHRLSAAGEAVALTWFWVMSRERRMPRLTLLLVLDRVVLADALGTVGAVRAQHATNYGLPETITFRAGRCFGCDIDGDLFAHHVIEVSHGGSNRPRNQVPLCADCHGYVHPWLDVRAQQRLKQRPSGFVRLGDLMAKQ